MMHIGPPFASMDLYLRREKGTISGVIHDMRAGKWACISGLDQLLLYLADVIDEEQGQARFGRRKKPRPGTAGDVGVICQDTGKECEKAGTPGHGQ